MMKNVLILGATGSIGLYLTEYLSNYGYKVYATGLKNRNTNYYQNRNIDYYSIDISNASDFLKLPQSNIDCVILLAGIMPARMSIYDPYKYIYVNILGTLNTLEYCRKNNICKLIFSQSHSDVSGYWNTGKLINEDDVRKLNFKGDHAIYIISKCTAVDLIEHYHQEYGIQNIIFRLPTIYCYWPDSLMYVDGIKREIAYLSIIREAINGEPIEIWGDPKIAKDIVYVKDFIQMIEEAINNDIAQGIYNVGTGIPTTLEEQIRGIVDVFSQPGKKSEIVYRPDKPSQTSYLYDVSKAKRDLHYQVMYPYIEMLRDMKKEMNNPWFSQITKPA